MKKTQATIYIKGDRNLVEELLSSLEGTRPPATGTINGGTPRAALPRGMKSSTRVPRGVQVALELSQDTGVKRNNLRILDRLLPPPAIIISSSVFVTAAEQSFWMRHPQRLIGASAFPTLLGRPMIELAATTESDENSISAARTFCKEIGKEFCFVQDRVGMVMPRILCMVINEAAFALNEEIASPADIDAAMKLGTNYPEGPIRWGEAIGFRTVGKLLLALREDLGEERYRPAPLIRQLSLRQKGK